MPGRENKMDITGTSLDILNEAILNISNYDNLPGFWEIVCQNIKLLISAKNICILLLSAENIPETIIQYEKGSFSDYLLQPQSVLFYKNLILTGKVSWLENTENDDQLFNWLSGPSESVILSLPLKTEKGNFGTILIATGNLSKQAKKDSVTALNIFAGFIATKYKLLKISGQAEYYKELEKLYKEVQDSNEALQNFAYIASHDLQAPLRTISGYIHLLLRSSASKLGNEEREFVNFIISGTKRMQALISSMLEYSKIGYDKTEYIPIDFNKIVEIVLADLKSDIIKNQALIICDKLPTLKVEQSHIIRLFQNLIENAIEYRGENPPIIRMTAEKTNNNYYTFSVSDNGIGIRKSYHNKIFELFKRINQSENREGAGIGLANCRKIVELHGGKIWVESEDRHGSTFKFTIAAD